MSSTKTVTMKLHKAERKQGETRATLHPLDPHEEGVNELATEPRSGEGKLYLRVTDPAALDFFFKAGDTYRVTFEKI